MSFFSVAGFSMRLCRQAFILANHKTPLRPFELPVTNYVARAAHNSLFQMVKKRTLEARTKLQPNKFPNNDETMQDTPEMAMSSSADNVQSPDCTPAKARDSKKSKDRSDTCQNQEVLRAADCNSRSYISVYTPCLEGRPELKMAPAIPPKRETKPEYKRETKPEYKRETKTDYKRETMQNSTQCKTAPEYKRDTVQDYKRELEYRNETPDCNPPRRRETKPECKNEAKSDHNRRKPCPPIEDIECRGGGGGGGSDSTENKMKMLAAALAALVTGGLLWMLLGGKKKKDCPQVTDPASNAPVVAPRTIPVSSADLPKHIPYLLIGGGTAAFSAFRAIKSNDPKAKVLMITNELKKPYMRPPLSKELWYSAKKGDDVKQDYRFKQWTGSERSLFFEPEEFFVEPAKLVESVNGGIAVAQGFSVRKIDAENRIATLNDGYEIAYDECLLATGCSPKSLTVFENAPMSVKERIMVYRTPEDFERLKKYADEKRSITIVGNGFIGSELACSLANYSKDNKGLKIYQVFPESGNMSKVLPDYLSKWTTKKVEALGVCVLPNTSVRECLRDESVLKLELTNGATLLTDVVVVCVGCEANTTIANVSGLEVDRSLGGFVVNAELEARRNLFVAGDASCFYDPLLGRRRVEHHDHSVVSGRLAGENMAGKKKAYAHQSMFWSDLGPEIGYEGIGLVDAKLPTVGVFALPSKADRRTDNLTETRVETIESEASLKSDKNMPDVKCEDREPEEYGRGVIFYMKDEKIVGILLWNLFNRIGLARTIINQNKKFDDLNEVAKLFEIHA